MIPPYIKIICFLFHPLGMVIRYQRNVYEFFTLCLRNVKITGKKEKPDRLQADAICLMYQTLGKERLFRLMAKGENDAACRYVPLGILFPQIERIRQEEQKHAQALLSLL